MDGPPARAHAVPQADVARTGLGGWISLGQRCSVLCLMSCHLDDCLADMGFSTLLIPEGILVLLPLYFQVTKNSPVTRRVFTVQLDSVVTSLKLPVIWGMIPPEQ